MAAGADAGAGAADGVQAENVATATEARAMTGAERIEVLFMSFTVMRIG